MEIVSNREELLERLKDMQAVEMKARDSYVMDTGLFNNLKIVAPIGLIKEDEDNHIKLLQELIDLLEK